MAEFRVTASVLDFEGSSSGSAAGDAGQQRWEATARVESAHRLAVRHAATGAALLGPLPVQPDTAWRAATTTVLVAGPPPAPALALRCASAADADALAAALLQAAAAAAANAPAAHAATPSSSNAFDAKTDAGSAELYFRYYAQLQSQQNMLQDATRTGTYHAAITENAADFAGKVVMDVGAGSGILSLFAARAGARRVWAVEASGMAPFAAKLAAANGGAARGGVVRVLHCKVEELAALPADDGGDEGDEGGGGGEESAADAAGAGAGRGGEGGGAGAAAGGCSGGGASSSSDGRVVDVLVSEPMGTLLINERMLESYLHARDRFLRPGGKMFPQLGRIHVAAFSDPVLHAELAAKALFWQTAAAGSSGCGGGGGFYGVDLSPLHGEALRQYFSQVVIDAFEPSVLVSDCATKVLDFATMRAEELLEVEVPLALTVAHPCSVHGVATWFDVLFSGSASQRWLSTAPGLPTTHWFQLRCVLQAPLLVLAPNARITGALRLVAHERQSYDVYLELEAPPVAQGMPPQKSCGRFDLKEPYHRQLNTWAAQHAAAAPAQPLVAPAAAAAAAPLQQVVVPAVAAAVAAAADVAQPPPPQPPLSPQQHANGLAACAQASPQQQQQQQQQWPALATGV